MITHSYLEFLSPKIHKMLVRITVKILIRPQEKLYFYDTLGLFLPLVFNPYHAGYHIYYTRPHFYTINCKILVISIYVCTNKTQLENSVDPDQLASQKSNWIYNFSKTRYILSQHEKGEIVQNFRIFIVITLDQC